MFTRATRLWPKAIWLLHSLSLNMKNYWAKDGGLLRRKWLSAGNGFQHLVNIISIYIYIRWFNIYHFICVIYLYIYIYLHIHNFISLKWLWCTQSTLSLIYKLYKLRIYRSQNLMGTFLYMVRDLPAFWTLHCSWPYTFCM